MVDAPHRDWGAAAKKRGLTWELGPSRPFLSLHLAFHTFLHYCTCCTSEQSKGVLTPPVQREAVAVVGIARADDLDAQDTTALMPDASGPVRMC